MSPLTRTVPPPPEPVAPAGAAPWQDGGAAVATGGLQVSGMVCAACAGLVEQAALGVPGVLEARVNAASGQAIVRWEPGTAQLADVLAAIRAAGYDAVPDAAAPARALRRREHRVALWRLFVAAFCMMQVMTFATPAYVAAAGDLAPDLRALLNWGSWLISLPVVVFAAGPFFQGAWRSLRAGRIGMDVPVALGVAVTFVASSGATFDPQGPFGHEVYFDSLTMFVTFLLGGRLLELRARHRAAAALEDALGGLPETALRLRADGTLETVPLDALAAGDRVRVPVGQAFPADGELTDGGTDADESLLSGESRAVPKAPGDGLVAGSVNLRAPVTMVVRRAGADTRFEAILALMREAATQRPGHPTLADRIAGPFLWVVLLLAAVAGLVWSQIDPGRAVWVMVSVLIVTCPCALSLAAPAARLAAAGALARRGVIVRRLDMLEALTRVDTVLLDKTGTLTTRDARTARVEPVATHDDAAALHAAARELAAWSTHPLSRAIAQGQVPQGRFGDVIEVPGRGVQGRDREGRTWRLGAPAWVGDTAAPADGVAFGDDGRARLRLHLDEAVRDEAAQAVRALQAAGLSVSLLSGDAPERAAAVGARLGLAQARGGASPEDKLQALKHAQAAGHRVAMVGDGINDAPVLAQADVSFAMGEGALVARAQADAVIAGGRLDALPFAHALAHRCVRVARQNLAWAATYNAVCIPLALAGLLPPWAAGLGMAGSSLAVVANAMRLAR